MNAHSGAAQTTSTGVRRRRRTRRLVRATPAVALLTALSTAGFAGPVSAAPAGLHLHATHATAVPVRAVPIRRVAVPKVADYQPPATSWAAGSATVTTSAVQGQLARAGALPVQIASKGPARQTATVSVLTRAQTAAAGVHGIIVSLAGPARTFSTPLSVQVDAAGFAGAFGGDYATRLRLVRLPSCVLTTPQLAACRTETPLVTSRSGSQLTTLLPALSATPAATIAAASPADTSHTDTSEATAAQPAAATPDMAVVAATAGPSGGAGDYTATSLKAAGSWSEGGSSGSFDYSYPLPAPPVPGGLAPTVELDYSSQAVDGDTSATNNQASAVGDGWDLNTGFIERSFQSCQRNPAGATKTSDECWSSNNVENMSLDGHSTQLIDNSSSTGWHAVSDENERITYCTGSSTANGCLGTTSNGTSDSGYWVVTTTDGTRYVFGLDELPGYASGDATTNSAWTVPVFSTASGQPCYNATFSKSVCQNTAWRWNLDYVVDPLGDAASYWYTPETNYYAEDGASTATNSYDRGGYLTSIHYGQRSNTVYSATPAAEVNFTYTGRCTQSTCTPSTLSSSTASQWPDVPYDQICASGATCSNTSPTYFSEYALSTVKTVTLEGSSFSPVDAWTLVHSFPATGDSTTSPSLWLASVARTGDDGAAITLPPTTFTPSMYANRVHITDGYALLTRGRITTIQTEAGAVESITYTDTLPGVTSCSSQTPTESQNTNLCYPVYWTPPGQPSPIEDWFNKYVVNAVSVQDPTGGQDTMQSNYAYSGAAWSEDVSPLTETSPTNERTWNVWRGFRTVTTTQGTSPDPITEEIDTYFQGMNGDPLPNNATRSVSLTDSRGDTAVPDNIALAGVQYETRTYNGDGGALLSDTIDTPWISAPTGTQTYSGLPTLDAVMTDTTSSDTYTSLASGGSRFAQRTSTFDSDGRLIKENNAPDSTDAGDDTCTTISYAQNTTLWILNSQDETKTVSVPCSTTPTYPADAVDDTRTFYDQSTTLGAAPSTGVPTMTELATSYTGSAPVFTMQTEQTVDEYGRELTSTDADNRVTSTAYTPATGAEPTTIAVTDPLKLTTTSTLDPARDLPTETLDPAGYATYSSYDSLGRLLAVWEPGNATSQPANTKYTYALSQTGPSVVATDTLGSTGTYRVSETLYDALLRPVETQTGTPDGGRDITDTTYNSDGWVILSADPYYATGVPSTTLVNAQANKVPSDTGYTYDGDGRTLSTIAYSYATETWQTTSSYGGNFVTTVPPTGGVPTTTITDGLGRITGLLQYHAGAPTNAVTDPASDYDQTSYSYSYGAPGGGQIKTMTNVAGQTWTYDDNLSGETVSQSDPDSGTATNTYDPAGELLSSTDARGDTTSFAYDSDSRKTAEYNTTGGASESSSDELAAWTYDTVKKGLLTGSTSYVGGTSGAAYSTTILAYNSLEKVQAQRVTIPSTAATTDGSATLAGTYTTSFTYKSNGVPATQTDQAAAGLPGETITTGYDAYDEPTSLTSSTENYVSDLIYDEYGKPAEYTFGPSTDYVQLALGYDPQTQRITTSTVADSTSSLPVDQTTYSYDAAGNPTKQTDVMNGNTSDPETQCFQYDDLDRLVQVWTATDNCAATPNTTARSTVGGPDPYWQSWTYNVAGDRTSETDYDTAGPASGDVTTTSAYPTSTTSQPNALTSVSSSSSTVGTTSFSYDQDGDLKSVSNPTVPADAQTLTWSATGKLASDSTAAGTSSYVYDAGGDLLLEQDPTSTTLYLGDEQLTLNTTTATTSGLRFYTIGATQVAVRSSAGTIDDLIDDRQRTPVISIDASTQTVARRLYTPFGTLVDGTATLAGTTGYVGGTANTSTGLENLGLREYDPAIGRFISPDPLVESCSPQQLDGYSYAADNPVTNEDQTGAMIEGLTGSERQAIDRVEEENQVRPTESLPTHASTLPAPHDQSTGSLWSMVLAVRPLVTQVNEWFERAGDLAERASDVPGQIVDNFIEDVLGPQETETAGRVSSFFNKLLPRGMSAGQADSALETMFENPSAGRVISALADSKFLEVGGKVTGVLGVGLTGWENYSDNRKDHGIAVSVAESGVQTAVDTGISYAAVGYGAEGGAVIGTAICPGVGTVIGLGVGAVGGMAVSYFASGAVNEGINDATGAIISAGQSVSSAASSVGNAVGGAADDVGGAVSGAASDVVSSVSSWF